MKVCINMLENNKDIGPVIFAKRLAKEFGGIGVDVVPRSVRHDILLAFIRDHDVEGSRRRGAKVIQRLDGTYYDSDKDYTEMNRTIKETSERVDAIIYQSEFSKSMAKRYLGVKDKMSFTILNGADPSNFCGGRDLGDEVSFLCSAKWRPTKRIDSIVRGFEFAKIPNSELVVLGDPDLKIDADNVKYLGAVPSSDLSSYYSRANYFIHLAYNDPCPNSVVEALVSGLPVVCAESGGTKELVRNSGEIILGDRLSVEPCHNVGIPFVDSRKVSDALHRCIDNRGSYEFPREDLHIGTCAKNYKLAFEKVLSTRASK